MLSDYGEKSPMERRFNEWQNFSVVRADFIVEWQLICGV